MRPNRSITPLPAVLAFSAANSFAAGTATVGVFFITKKAFGFSEAANYLLGLVVGVTYVIGALGAGPTQRSLARRGGISARRFVGLMTVLLAVLCLVPSLVRRPWAIYAFLAVYAPITGLFWPLVESFLSGGRRGERLRSAVGRFNVVWSAGLAAGLVVEGPFLERHAFAIFPMLAVVHVLSLIALVSFPSQPGQHEDEAHVVPDGYPALLHVHRLLLAAAYIVMYTLAPYAPKLTAELQIEEGWRTPLAATWMAARVVTFQVMERWHGWHGRFATAVFGALTMVGGFAVVVLAPLVLSGTSAIAMFVLGLVAFGVGVAALYTAALYYVLEVGAAEVEAAGSHEALIGLGYTIGPSCGLAVIGLAETGAIAEEAQDGVLVALVTLISLAALAWAARSRPRASAPRRVEAPRRAG